MKRLLLLLLCGCGGAIRPSASVARSSCSAADAFDGTRCRRLNGDVGDLKKGLEALREFRAEEAVAALEKASAGGPYRHPEILALYQDLSVAYAYLGNEARALSGFDMLLSLEPGYAIPYTLSPKATFLFERARDQRPRAPELRVTWPRDLDVARTVPVEIEVLSDPKQFLRRARVFSRARGESNYRIVDVELRPPGQYRKLALPPTAPAARHNKVLELYVTAYDQRGNEVLLWGDAERPKEIWVGYHPPTPWYKKWWVWTVAGVGVAAVTGVTVYAVTRDPPGQIGGEFTSR